MSQPVADDEHELGPELRSANELVELEDTEMDDDSDSDGDVLLLRLKFRLLAGLGCADDITCCCVEVDEAFVAVEATAAAAAAAAVGAMGLWTTVLLL